MRATTELYVKATRSTIPNEEYGNDARVLVLFSLYSFVSPYRIGLVRAHFCFLSGRIGSVPYLRQYLISSVSKLVPLHCPTFLYAHVCHCHEG